MDPIDFEILTKLQGNCRISNAELARQVGLAASSMLERVRKLEDRKIIRGYRALIDPSALGLEVQAFVAVTLATHQSEVIRNFERQLHKLPQVTAAFHMSGRFDYLLRVVAKNLADLGLFLKETIAIIKGIGKVESFLTFSTIKDDHGLPIEQAAGAPMRECEPD